MAVSRKSDIQRMLHRVICSFRFTVHLCAAEPTEIAGNISRVFGIAALATPKSAYKPIAAERLYLVRMHHRRNVEGGKPFDFS